MLKETQEMLLYLIYYLEQQMQTVSIDSIKRNLSWTENKPLVLENEIEWLIEKGYITREEDSRLTLTNNGRIESDRISKIMVKDEFNKKIDRLTKSAAYLNFCEEVYGYRMYLFNMMDKQQLDFIINSISISSKDILMDLGCGAGSILNTLVAKYECKGIGIDQLNNDIVEKNSRMITYINGDIDRVSELDVKPSITLAIDSLYFSNNLENLIQQLRSISNNRLYLFYSQYVLDEFSGDRSILHCDKTRLAEALKRNGVFYKTIDYCENERLLYENSLRVLPKFRNAFEFEGNKDLYEAKLREDMSGKEMYDKGMASRYLYIIE